MWCEGWSPSIQFYLFIDSINTWIYHVSWNEIRKRWNLILFSESPNLSSTTPISLVLCTPPMRDLITNRVSFLVKKNLLNFSISDSVFLAQCSVVGWVWWFFVLLLSKFFSSLRWCMNKIRKKVSAVLHRRKRTKSTFPFIFHLTVTDITFQFSFIFFFLRAARFPSWTTFLLLVPLLLQHETTLFVINSESCRRTHEKIRQKEMLWVKLS